MPITISKAALSKSLREVRDKAREQGRAEGRAEAARMLEFAVKLNGHGPATVKALRDGIDPAVRTSPEAATPEAEDDRDPNPLDAATLAYIDALIEAKTHHAESDGGDVAAALRQMIDDPSALEAALSGDVLPGGEGDNRPAADFDPEQLAAGIEVESEHTDDPNNAEEIAKDHLTESPDYYRLIKAWNAELHPRDDAGRFVSKEAIHAAKSDPKKAEELRNRVTDPEQRKKLDAALAGEADLGRTKAGLHRDRVAASKQQKAERLGKVRKLAEEISMARRGGEDVPPEHFTELAAELPHLTVGQLRSVRESLAASFWGRRRRDEMVTALVRHAKVMAERKRAEQEATDALDFGMEAMSNTGGTGHADAGRSDLNPWREFDKDKSFSEAQHGGRMYQRHKLMSELPESDKTSHGTPDTGSILKVPDKVADEQLTQKLNGPDEPPTQPEAAAHTQAPSYTTDKPQGNASVMSEAASKWLDSQGGDLSKVDHDAISAAARAGQLPRKAELELRRAKLAAEEAEGDTAPQAAPEQAATTSADADKAIYDAFRGKLKPDVHPAVKERFYEAAKTRLAIEDELKALERIKAKASPGSPEWNDAVNKIDDATKRLHAAGKVDLRPPVQPESAPSEPIASTEPVASTPATEAEWHAEVKKIKADHARKVWDEVQKRLDNGETVQFNTMTRRVPISPKNRAAMRITPGGDIQVARGKHWDSLAGQGIDTLAANVGVRPPELPPFPQKPDEGPGKASHEMTRDEYVTASQASPDEADAFRNIHRNHVEQALKRGDTVPPEVLADYPDLKQPSQESPDNAPAGAAEPEKSKGHVAFVNGIEYFRDDDGTLLRADSKLPIDTTGKRFGRFEAPAHLADMRVKMLTGQNQPREKVNDAGAKEPHQYSRKDYLGSESDREAVKRISNEHREAVRAAIAAGKDVSPEVLADYPDLDPKKSIPTDHTAALSSAKAHHNRRTDTKGKPLPAYTVYRDAAGKVQAVPSDSYMGKELAKGSFPQYKVEGQYEFGADGKPVAKAGGAETLPKSQENVSSTVDKVDGQADTTPVEPQPAAPKQEKRMETRTIRRGASTNAPQFSRGQGLVSKDGKWSVVMSSEAIRNGPEDDDIHKYTHEAKVRDASPAESAMFDAKHRAAALKKQLTGMAGGPDDEQGAAAHAEKVAAAKSELAQAERDAVVAEIAAHEEALTDAAAKDPNGTVTVSIPVGQYKPGTKVSRAELMAERRRRISELQKAASANNS